jgi:hypothetical protein
MRFFLSTIALLFLSVTSFAQMSVGEVTTYMNEHPADKLAHLYVCGNNATSGENMVCASLDSEISVTITENALLVTGREYKTMYTFMIPFNTIKYFVGTLTEGDGMNLSIVMLQ